MQRRIRVGTRGSALAMRQTRLALDGLRAAAAEASFEVVEVNYPGRISPQ